jgi:hypothetical protein
MKKLVFSMMIVAMAMVNVASADVAIGNPNAGNGWSTTSAVTATASGDQYGLVPTLTIDGSGLDAATGTMHDIGWAQFWDSLYTGATNPHPGAMPDALNWIAYEFDKPYELTKMHVWNYNFDAEWRLPASAKDIVVLYSLTGGPDPMMDWNLMGMYTLGQGTAKPDYTGEDVFFGGEMAKYVVISIMSDYASPYGDNGLSEVRFYAVPEPATMLLLGLGALAIRRCRA